MSSVATSYDDKSTNGERRGSRRESLKRVVLVFFGENNWGKLTDVSENGMSFEFAQEPALRQQMDFRLETMGCVVAHLGGEPIHKSFEVAGKVLWTRQFERAAGAQFVDLTESSREQIQSLLILDAMDGVGIMKEAFQSEAMVPGIERLESPRSHLDVPGEGEGEEGRPDAEEESIIEPDGVEPSGRPQSELVERIFEAVTSGASQEPNDEPGQPERLSKRRSGILRIGLAVAGGCIVVVSSVAVARRIPAPWARRTEAVLQLQNFLGNKGRTAALKGHAPATNPPKPFLVEVSDSNRPTWLLGFVPNDSKDLPKPVASRSATSFSPSPAGKKGPGQEHFSSATSRGRFPESRRIAPQISHPQTKALAAPPPLDQAPVVPDDAAAGLALNGSIPGLEAGSPVLGGQVQPARLLKAVPPVYPALAKARHVGGDVTLDALIDAGGNVTKVRVTSGPVDLQQAAIEAVREWKYEPARLDGRPVAMHLSVVVKFNVK